MNLSWAHVHLLLNHFPIVGAIFGLLLLVYAIAKDSKELKQASYWLFIIIALLAIPVYLSGEQAAEIIHDLPGVSDTFIHEHESVAEQAFIALEILGAISLAGLFAFRGGKRIPGWFTVLLITVTFIAVALVSWAGLQGGIIRHTEVREDLPFLIPQEAGFDNHESSKTKKVYSDLNMQSKI